MITATSSSRSPTDREASKAGSKSQPIAERQNSSIRSESIHSTNSMRSNSISTRKRNISRSSRSSRKSYKTDDQNRKLKRVMMKQTILFMIIH